MEEESKDILSPWELELSEGCAANTHLSKKSGLQVVIQDF
jgi:hypothetical protein